MCNIDIYIYRFQRIFKHTRAYTPTRACKMVFTSHELYSIGKMKGNLDAQSRATLLSKVVQRQICEPRDPGSSANLLVVISTLYGTILIFYHVPTWVAFTVTCIAVIQAAVYYTNTRVCPTLVREVSDLLSNDAELLIYFYQALEESHRQERRYRTILVEALNRMDFKAIQGMDSATTSRMVVSLDLLSCPELKSDIKEELFDVSTNAVRQKTLNVFDTGSIDALESTDMHEDASKSIDAPLNALGAPDTGVRGVDALFAGIGYA